MMAKTFPEERIGPLAAIYWAAGLAILISHGPTLAAPWEYGFSLQAGGIHSDNIFLSADGFEESETVYQISPTLTLLKESERLNADIRYVPQALFYENTSDADEIYQVLDGTLQAVLVSDTFFVDVSGANFQIISDAENRFPTNNIPVSRERTDTAIWSLTPTWQQRFGGAAVQASATYRSTIFDDPETLDSEEKSGLFRIDNFSQRGGVSWAVDYQYLRLDYNAEALPWEYQQASLELGFWVSGQLRLFVGAGVETPFDAFFDPAMDDDLWEAGLEYSPSDRLDLEIAAGERSFGTTIRGRLSYRGRRVTSDLSYTESPSTQNNALAGRRPVQQTDNLDDFLARLDNNDQFIQRRGEWLNRVQLAKTFVSLRLFHEERDDRFQLDGTPLAGESYSGAAFRIDWDVGSKLNLGLSGDFARRDGESEEDLTRFGLNIAYQLTRKLELSGSAQRSNENSTGASFEDYSENQFALFATMVFL